MSVKESICKLSVLAAALAWAVLHVRGTALEGAPSPVAHGTPRRPNILIIIADDLGYADLGCHGCQDIPTPNIDSLAKCGVRCSNGYVSCPVCSPTRAGLFTGRYQQRFGHEFNPGQIVRPGTEFGLPLSEATLADRLRAAGYSTGLVGKWHLGFKEEFHPLKRGFDDFFGFLEGFHSYVDPKASPRNPILRGRETVDEKEYLTEAFTREAAAFIERHRQEPFFLCLAYNAVHMPLEATEKYLARFESIADLKRRTYAAMLSAMDDGIGTVLKKLRESGIEENTLIVFISDNGGPSGRNASRNSPFSGVKGQLREGGIRVPFFMQWKGRLPAGKVFEQPVIALDIFPTALAAAEVKLPEGQAIDGVSLLPHLTGAESRPPHEILFWRYGKSFAARKGSWKLLKVGSNSPQLFDLAADPGEMNDLAAQKPEVVKELDAALKVWNAQLAEPLWQARPGEVIE